MDLLADGMVVCLFATINVRNTEPTMNVLKIKKQKMLGAHACWIPIAMTYLVNW